MQAFGLACGFLFLSLYQGVLAGYENCLDKVDSSFTVDPAPKDKPDEPGIVKLNMGKPKKAATVTLASNAPDGGSVICGTAFSQSLSKGASLSVKLEDLEWSGGCTFSSAAGTKSEARTIRACVANA